MLAWTHLFIRPRQFFSNDDVFMRRGAPILGVWISGIAALSDQIDKRLWQAERKGVLEGPLKTVVESWPAYWATLLAMGLTWALFLWFVGGWWYGQRLKMAGAIDPDMKRARAAYIYQSLVYAVPALLISASYLLKFPNYLAAWQAAEIWPTAIGMAALVFSCWTSFVAATTAFSPSWAKAAFWFMALPLILYAVLFGVVFSSVK